MSNKPADLTRWRRYWKDIVLLIAGVAANVAVVNGADLQPKMAESAKQSDSQREAAVFETRVRPILKAKCSGCHGGKTPKAELNLSTPEGILKGSESGVVVIAGQPGDSLLYEMVSTGEMPPKKKDRLSKAEVETIRQWIAAGASMGTSNTARGPISQHDVLPILRLRCTVCHGRQTREAGLDLRSRESMLKGGKSGPAFVAGRPGESLLLKKIKSGAMPPRERLAAVSVKPMAAGELALLTQWIERGAAEIDVSPDVATTAGDPLVSDADRQFWSFQPPVAVPPPDVINYARVNNPIDAFILRKLEAHGLSLAPAASRHVLIRRAYFDLHGLPPTPAEIRAFLADYRPGAFERLIDRLLASPRYGERWGRYWLDLAGYADSEGIQHGDPIRPHAYRYRDYVIRALNDDRPYDQFLMQQIAGDELADYRKAKVITQEMYDNLVATGFLRMSADGTFSGITGFVPDRLEVIDDQIEILSSAVLGLTIKCARCHAHKFDPIPQRDYYRLAAVFKGALDEHDWLKPSRQSAAPGKHDRYLPYVTSEERRAWETHNKKLDDQIAELKKSPGGKQHDADFKKKSALTNAKIKSLEGKKQPEPLIRALWDRGEPSPTYILSRGNYLTRGRLVGPGPPTVLTDGKTPFEVSPPWSGAKPTGRRTAFAKWLIRPDHPLTARVVVNRMWKHHFGAGIVATLDNFGKAGARPTHPELLDWLAVEFVRRGWSMKSMHRLMMTSSSYRQSSLVTPRLEKLDPENRLMSRMPLRRLDAESLRDTLLFISGRLNFAAYGPPDGVVVQADGLVRSVASHGGWRRSIYVLQRRTQLLTILENFDRPAMNPNCIDRPESTVVPQALYLTNDRLVHELSMDFAKRIQAEVGGIPDRQIHRLYLMATGRPPTAAERLLASETLERLRQKWEKSFAERSKDGSAAVRRNEFSLRALGNLCHAMMNSATFLYID